jgi:hypothetical protein
MCLDTSIEKTLRWNIVVVSRSEFVIGLCWTWDIRVDEAILENVVLEVVSLHDVVATGLGFESLLLIPQKHLGERASALQRHTSQKQQNTNALLETPNA